MLVPPADAYVGQALIRMGQYCPAEFATWRPYVPAGGVVVDAGANLGAHTMAFALTVGPGGVVFAIEPQRSLFHMICGSAALCGVSQIVIAKHIALAREAGSVRVPILDYGAPQNFGGLSLSDVLPPDAPSEPVPAIPLDAMQLPRLDFLKIDVEGAELSVLHGAKETIGACRPVLSVEADREKNVPATLAWLRLNGYRAWWHRPLLGALWPRVASQNLLALPRDREDLPAPEGVDEMAIE
jgi:FkbM family methyltransferase